MKYIIYIFLVLNLRVNLMGQDDARMPDNLFISYFIKEGKLEPTNIIIGTSIINGIRSVDLMGIGWHEYLKVETSRLFFIAEEHGKEFDKLEIDNRLSANETFFHMQEMPISNEVF